MEHRASIYVVQELQLPTVTWDVVSGDPSARTTADGMIRTVLGKARAGSIIIFHINGRGWKTAAGDADHRAAGCASVDSVSCRCRELMAAGA